MIVIECSGNLSASIVMLCRSRQTGQAARRSHHSVYAGRLGRFDAGAAENARKAKQRLTLRNTSLTLWRIPRPDENVWTDKEN